MADKCTYDSAEAHAYRENLRARPSNSSTPAARETPQFPHQSPHFPVSHHPSGPTPHHVETVGYTGNGAPYKQPTHPNADRMHGTDGHLHEGGGGAQEHHQQFGPYSIDKEPQRRGKTSSKG